MKRLMIVSLAFALSACAGTDPYEGDIDGGDDPIDAAEGVVDVATAIDAELADGAVDDGPAADAAEDAAVDAGPDASIDAAPCVPQTEVCNGVDDNCDSNVDEGFGLGSFCDGQDGDDCEEGTIVCDGAGGTVCGDTTGTTVELCNGTDDDCDGATDEGFVLGGACDGTDSNLCQEGTTVCDGPGTGTTCSDTTGSTLDVCNGADDDCNPTSADGSEDAQNGGACDGSDGNLCEEGTLSCVSGGLACSDATGNTLDVCNGVDDDCNLASLDGSEDAQNGSACDGADGDLCAEGTRSCVGGGFSCSDASGTTADVCNGLDDDCDPASGDGSEDAQVGMPCDGTDSDLCAEGTRSCAGGDYACSDATASTVNLCNGFNDDCDPASADGSEDPAMGDACDGPDGDQCAEGTLSCMGGAPACSDGPGSSAEICDGVDNDCDGSIDEGFSLGAACDGGDSDLCTEGTIVCNVLGTGTTCSDLSGSTTDVCNGIDDDCDLGSADGQEDPLTGTGCDGGDSDLCVEGLNFCSGGAIACGDATGSSVDVCNGSDDDCDLTSADGSEDPLTGGACDGADSDLCTEGTRACVGGGFSCSDATGSTLDVCNGADDDCDLASADGSEDAQNGAACDGTDTDSCNEGIKSCSGGTLSCSDATGSTTDVCNGVDDDCNLTTADGSADPQNGTPCDGADSDSCNEGTKSCSGGGLQCSDATGNTVETCNGADDDCNGTIDNGGNACGGVCALGGTPGGNCDGADGDLCNEGTFSCNGLNAVTCSDGTSTNVETCNATDDDCDGSTDEGGNACGGVCPLGGVPGASCDGSDADFCNEGSFACNGLNGVTCGDANDLDLELCNGADDDCNPGTGDGSGNPAVGAACDGSDADVCTEGATNSCVSGGLSCNDAADANNVCSGSAFVLSSIAGDAGADVRTDSFFDSEWDIITIREDSNSSIYLSATISLVSPPGADFDLFVYCNSCGGGLAGSSQLGGLDGHTDTVNVRSDDDFGSTDDFTVLIEIRHFSSNACANWDLTVTGNTTVNTETCN